MREVCLEITLGGDFRALCNFAANARRLVQQRLSCAAEMQASFARQAACVVNVLLGTSCAMYRFSILHSRPTLVGRCGGKLEPFSGCAWTKLGGFSPNVEGRE